MLTKLLQVANAIEEQEKFVLENILLCSTPKFTNNQTFQLHNWQLHELNHLRRII